MDSPALLRSKVGDKSEESPLLESDPFTDFHQTLTKESLFLLNLQHNGHRGSSHLDYDTTPTLTITESSTPDMSSSSTSSLASFDENSEDRKRLEEFYNYKNGNNNSTSSIATIVQKLESSSTSTLNLQSKSRAYENLDSDVGENKSVETGDETIIIPGTPQVDRQVPRKIKSSLRLPGLTRSRSVPSNIVKTVRFSNDLTKVKTFNEHAKPSSISLDNSPETSPPFNDLDTVDDRLSSSSSSFSSPKAFFDLKTTLGYSSSDSDESEEDYFSYRSKLSNNYKWILKFSNFDLFASHNKLNHSQHVKLTSLSTLNNSLLIGTIQVENIAFEKYVEIKFTTDNWNSIYLVTGKYERSLDSTKDQFRFEINLDQSLLMNTTSTNNSKSINVSLCVKYVADSSSIFYDNNSNENYQFQLVNQPKNRVRKSKSTPNYTSLPLSSSSSLSFRHSSNFNRGNFSSNVEKSKPVINTPSKNSNYTTTHTTSSSSTRYFSDDTDYFNSTTVHNPVLNSWISHSNDSSALNSPTIPTKKTTASSLPSSPTLSSSSSSLHKRGDYNQSAAIQSKDQTYNDFLNKYCFFKSDNPRSDINASIFT